MIPLLAPAEFERTLSERCGAGERLCALVPYREEQAGDWVVTALLADDAGHKTSFLSMSLPAGSSYPSLTVRNPGAEAFERDLFETTGLKPEGHPWLKPLRLRSADAPYRFFAMAGEGLHEVAVGPVHAGIIEPGHFRFQCHGEEVFHLEIRLGYQHRGAEQLLLRSHPERRLAVAESVAGDTAVGHAWAYCSAIESLGSVVVPPRAEAIRGIALELERLANHAGDLGALCNDVGFLPGSAYLGRLRGEFLNLTARICGNRFGRGLLVPGGVRFDIPDPMRREMERVLVRAERELEEVMGMVFETNTIVSRFEKTGVLTSKSARELGIVGPAGRASECDRDVRRDHPCGIYKSNPISVPVRTEGDVMARAVVRWRETKESLRFVKSVLGALPAGELKTGPGSPKPDAAIVSMVEGWRGEIVHAALTDASGNLRAFKIVDPSFRNWFGLAMAVRANGISDFPLCNKSFNLSYAGHDL